MVLDIIGATSIICSTVGLIMFILANIIVYKILQLFPKARMRRDWLIIFILIAFFSMGYVVNIVSVALNLIMVELIMQALVYLFGAIFVFIIIQLSYKTYKIILEAAESESN
ncbi:MAG: hypothetical protein ACTSRW_08605 [Candidatus Helarchaeota archaeon]